MSFFFGCFFFSFFSHAYTLLREGHGNWQVSEEKSKRNCGDFCKANINRVLKCIRSPNSALVDSKDLKMCWGIMKRKEATSWTHIGFSSRGSEFDRMFSLGDRLQRIIKVAEAWIAVTHTWMRQTQDNLRMRYFTAKTHNILWWCWWNHWKYIFPFLLLSCFLRLKVMFVVGNKF